MADEPTSIEAPIVIDLGKTRRKSIKQLKEGRGPLADEVRQAVEEAISQLGEAAKGKEFVPLVVQYKRKPKKRQRKGFFPFNSSGIRDLQKFERGVSKASHRVANSVAVGLETYFKEGNRSARKRQDGALRDSMVNAGLAMGDTLQELSRVPSDLAKHLPTGFVWRRVRSALRMARPMR